LKRPNSENAGFTLIEILIVMGIMAMLIVLSAPFVTTLRSQIAMQGVLRQVKVDLVSTMSYSLAGKSYAALSEDDLMNPELIPAAYLLYFQKDADFGGERIYKYLELTAEEALSEKPLKTSYEFDHELSSPGVFLQDISLLNRVTGASQQVDAAYIVIMPPFGKVLFINDDQSFLSRLDAEELYRDREDFDEIQLTFQYKDRDFEAGTLSFSKDKILNIL